MAIADALARRGAKVVLAARKEEALQVAAEKLARDGGEPLAVRADVTDDAQVEAMVERTIERFGRLDLLVNAAGRSTRGNALDTTPAEFAELMELNFGGAVRCARAAAPHLITSRGHLVNIGSLASKFVSRYLGAYPASKFALAAYTGQLRLELADAGVHVLLVCPGPIARDDSESRYDAQAADLPPEARRAGAGVKLRGLRVQSVAERTLAACERRRPELILPAKARLLLTLAAISPRLGDWIVRKMTRGH